MAKTLETKTFTVFGESDWHTTEANYKDPDFGPMLKIIDIGMPSLSWGCYNMGTFHKLRNPEAENISDIKNLPDWRQICKQAKNAIQKSPTYSDQNFAIEIYGDRDCKKVIYHYDQSGSERFGDSQ